MTGRPAFPALGFDPAPGSPAAVDALAAGCAGSLRELTGARDAVLRAGVDAGGWQGPAADGFRSATADVPGRLDRIGRSVESAGSALRLWQADLVAMQRSAQRLESEAVVARDALVAARAHPDLALAGQVFTDPDELAVAERRLGAAGRDVHARQVEVADVRRRAELLRAQHTALAAELARALGRARDLVPTGRWTWEPAIPLLVPLVPAATWLRDNANTIAALADVTGDLSTMVGLAGMGLDLTGGGAPAGAALGMLSGGLSALALAGHLAARTGGADVPGETIVWDTVGAATLGLGRLPRVGRDLADLATVGAPSAQAGMEDATSDRAPTVFDNLEKYWVPRDPLQAWQYGRGGAGGLAVPYTNAWQDGRALDEQAAREREGR